MIVFTVYISRLHLLGIIVLALTGSLIVDELARVLISIVISLDAFAFSLAVLEHAFISGTIGPRHFANTVHVVITEFSFVNLPSFGEGINALTLKLSFNKVSFIAVALKSKLSLTRLLAIEKISLILDLAVVENFDTLAVMFVAHPLAIIHGALLIDIGSHSIGFALFPLPVVDTAICMNDMSLSLRHSLFGNAKVLGAISVFDISKTLPGTLELIGSPLAHVFTVLLNVNFFGVPKETSTTSRV